MTHNRNTLPPGPGDFLPVPDSVPAELVPIGEELSRLEESSRFSSQVQFEAAKYWHRWNLWLGVPASVFGLFTGGAAYTEQFAGWVIGTCALIGAALAGTMTVLGAERRSTRAKSCANTFHDIQDDARRLLNIRLADMDKDEAEAALAALTDRYSETRQTADAPARRFYIRAKENLGEGGQQFAIDAAKSNPNPSKTTSTSTDEPPTAQTTSEQENTDG